MLELFNRVAKSIIMKMLYSIRPSDIIILFLKYTLFIFILISTTNSYSQEYFLKNKFNYSTPDTNFRKAIPIKDGIAIFDSVVSIDGLKKNELFIKIKQWGLETFNSEKLSLESQDIDAGFIFYKLNIYKEMPEPALTKKNLLKIPNSYIYKFELNIKFYIKDNKYKIVISPISFQLQSEKYALKKVDINAQIYGLEEMGVTALDRYRNDRTNVDNIMDVNYFSMLCNIILYDIKNLFENNISSIKKNKKSDFEF